jgi:hypothetical protein
VSVSEGALKKGTLGRTRKTYRWIYQFIFTDGDHCWGSVNFIDFDIFGSIAVIEFIIEFIFVFVIIFLSIIVIFVCIFNF